MAPSAKLAALVLCAGHAYASYFGGIGVGPFMNSEDSAVCPPGTANGVSAFCCPTGTSQDVADDNDALICCPSSADCTQDLVNSGLQCADPSMTLFKNGGGSLLCCPSGYVINDLRFCVNNGEHVGTYTSTAQANSLTPDGSSPTAAPVSGSGSQAASGIATATADTDSAAATGTDGTDATGSDTGSGTASATLLTATTAASGTGTIGTAAAGSGTVGMATTVGGVVATGGATGGATVASTKTSSGTSTSTSKAAAAVVGAEAGGMLGMVLAVGAMILA